MNNDVIDSIRKFAEKADLTKEDRVQLNSLISTATKERLAGVPKTAGWDDFSLNLVQQGVEMMAPAILIAGDIMAIWAFEFLRQMISTERAKTQRSSSSDQGYYDVQYPYANEQMTSSYNGGKIE